MSMTSWRSTPWIRVWRRPTEVAAILVDSYPIRRLLWVLPICALIQVGGLLISSNFESNGPFIPVVVRTFGLNLALLFISLLIYGFFCYVAGRSLKGNGSLNRIQRAYLVCLVLSLPLVGWIQWSYLANGWYRPILYLVSRLGSYWVLIVNIHILAEAHYFTTSKSVASSMLTLGFTLPFVCLGGGLYLVLR